MTTPEAIERFARLVAGPPEEVDLARAALAIAAGGDPTVEPDIWIAELDRMAEDVDDVEGLRRRLFSELGFSGNVTDYYDPANSFLHRVIERRTGIPIALSVVVIEVGRRAGLALEGIGMPGHFLVRDRASGRYLDAFHGGRLITREQTEALFRATTGSTAPFDDDALPPASTHDILRRMLENLRAIYGRLGSIDDLEWVLRMRLALPGANAAEAVELGRVFASKGRFSEGAHELEALAERVPEGAELVLAAARGLRSRLN